VRLVDPDRPGRLIDVEQRETASFDGTRIAYQVAGSGRPVLLVGGLAGTFPVWRHLYRYLGDRYRFLAWDFRGLHRSGPAQTQDAPGLQDLAKDGLAVLRAEGAPRAAVLSWSGGTQVALEICRFNAEQVAALVLVGGAAGRPWSAIPGPLPVRPILRSFVRVAARFPSLASAAVGRLGRWPETLPWLKRAGILAPTLDEEVFSDLAEDFANVDPRIYFALLERFARHDARDVLPTLRMPVLVLAGDRDPLVSKGTIEEIARAIPGAELTVLPGGTHYTAVEFPELFNLRIEKFFLERGWEPQQAA